MISFFELTVVILLVGNYFLIANGLNLLQDKLMWISSIKSHSLLINRPGIVHFDHLDSCEACNSGTISKYWISFLIKSSVINLKIMKIVFLVVSALQIAFSLGMSTNEILKTASERCIAMNLQTPAVCNGTVDALGPELIEIMRNVNMTTAQVCYFIFDDSCKEIAEHPSHLWKISLPPFSKPTPPKIPIRNENVPKLKVLQLTDTHYDPFYLVGSNADCPEPMCCRESSTVVNSSFNAAGQWGAFKCDVPKRTFVHLLEFIAHTHKVNKSTWLDSIRPKRFQSTSFVAGLRLCDVDGRSLAT